MKPNEFYEILPDGRYRFRIDHSKLRDFNTCDRYFKFRHIPDEASGPHAGLVWGSKTRNIKMELGSWWSSTMELFYREMAFGVMPSDALIMKFARDAWAEHKMDAYALGDPKSKQVETYNKFGGIEGALTMALEYHAAFAHRHFVDWKIIGAELGFGWKDEVFVGEDDKVVVYWGGKPDLVVLDLAQNMVMPLDFKSKDAVPGNAIVQFKPHTQTAGYIFALREMLRKLQADQLSHASTASGLMELSKGFPKEPTKCMIMVCARFRPTDKPRSGVRSPRFLPVYPQYNPEELDEWRVEIVEKCRRLRDSIERRSFPSRDAACHLYYHGCAFRSVCSMPPSLREVGLRSDFVRVEPWLPYEVGEED